MKLQRASTDSNQLLISFRFWDCWETLLERSMPIGFLECSNRSPLKDSLRVASRAIFATYEERHKPSFTSLSTKARRPSLIRRFLSLIRRRASLLIYLLFT